MTNNFWPLKAEYAKTVVVLVSGLNAHLISWSDKWSIFIQFLTLTCQNLSYSFIYPTIYHLLTYIYSKLSYSCLKFFPFLWDTLLWTLLF